MKRQFVSDKHSDEDLTIYRNPATLPLTNIKSPESNEPVESRLSLKRTQSLISQLVFGTQEIPLYGDGEVKYLRLLEKGSNFSRIRKLWPW